MIRHGYWMLALALLAVAAEAHVLVYSGYLSETRVGGGEKTRSRLSAYLIIDTAHRDSETNGFNATIIVYKRVGSVDELYEVIEYGREWALFDWLDVSGRQGRELAALAGRQSYDSDPDHFASLLLQGAKIPDTYLYDDGGNPVRDSVVKVWRGVGQARRPNELEQETLVQQTVYLRLHSFTRAVNPTGGSGDYATAIRYVFDHLHISIPGP